MSNDKITEAYAEALESADVIPMTSEELFRLGYQAALQQPESEPVPFEVGGHYRTQGGKWVKFVTVHNQGTRHETMADENGVNRYTNRPVDMGRVTGTAHDYSDRRNTPPTYASPQPAAQVPEIEAEELAKRFHEIYERLAPQFGYETRPETRLFDRNSPNGRLMTAVCSEIRGLIQGAQVPEGYAILPRELTAENGAKYLMVGEFEEAAEETCGYCFGEPEGEDCEVCGGSGVQVIRLPVQWSTIKDIYRKVVLHLAAPSIAEKREPKS